MAHVFAIIEARRLWYEWFLDNMQRRRYPSRQRGMLSHAEPNCREIHFMDFSVPQDSIPYLMDDLTPYLSMEDEHWMNSPQRKVAGEIGRGIREIAGLHKIDHIQPKGSPLCAHLGVPHQWENIIPIGWKEDKFLDGVEQL